MGLVDVEQFHGAVLDVIHALPEFTQPHRIDTVLVHLSRLGIKASERTMNDAGTLLWIQGQKCSFDIADVHGHEKSLVRPAARVSRQATGKPISNSIPLGSSNRNWRTPNCSSTRSV